jgi:hypothetical protein
LKGSAGENQLLGRNLRGRRQQASRHREDLDPRASVGRRNNAVWASSSGKAVARRRTTKPLLAAAASSGAPGRVGVELEAMRRGGKAPRRATERRCSRPTRAAASSSSVARRRAATSARSDVGNAPTFSGARPHAGRTSGPRHARRDVGRLRHAEPRALSAPPDAVRPPRNGLRVRRTIAPAPGRCSGRRTSPPPHTTRFFPHLLDSREN